MVRTIQIKGTNEVMAMFGSPGTYYRGKWEEILITGVGKSSDVPIEIRKGLVGLIIPTIFTKESIEEQTGLRLSMPQNSRLAYSIDVVNVLESYGKHNEAKQLARIANNPLDMCFFEPEIYQLLENFSMDDFRGGRHPYKKDGRFTHPNRKD